MARKPKHVVKTYTGVQEASFFCEECDGPAAFQEAYNGRNAIGLAKQHAQRYGHTVHAEQTIGITYTPPDSDWVKSKESMNT